LKVSIVTVCRNSEATIEDTLKSVSSQTYSNIEHIIIDGASSDGTLSVINQYKDRVAHIVSEPDKGIYDAMNKGIHLATGDVIGILNSDDYFEYPEAVADVMDRFKSQPEADLVFGDVVFVKPDDLQKVVRHYSSGHFKSWKLRFGWMPPHPATFIRKQAYQLAGPYSLDYKISSDYEMLIRLLLVHGLSFSRVDKVLVRMRMGGLSTTGFRSSIRLNQEIVKGCRENGIYTNLLFVLSKFPFKLLERFKKPADSFL
jgi:glycosyltransferase involved in cell wall biosynthesis